jgi:ABC-type amino acid transport substrate-binding protein
MKHSLLKTLMLGAAALTASLIMAGCGGSTGDKAAASSAQTSDVIHVATTATFPPFEYVDGEGKYTGIDIDIANYIADKLGKKVEVQDMKFASLIPTLQSGRADMVISGISPTAKRSEVVDFTEPYFYPPKAIVALKGTNYDSLEALKGHKAGATMGTTYVNDLKAVDGIEVAELDSAAMAVQDVLNGRLDATLCDGTHAIVFCKEHPELEMHMMKLSTSRDDTFAIAFPKGSPLTAQANQILDEMKKNGDFHKILVKHMGEEQANKYESMVKELGLK